MDLQKVKNHPYMECFSVGHRTAVLDEAVGVGRLTETTTGLSALEETTLHRSVTFHKCWAELLSQC